MCSNIHICDLCHFMSYFKRRTLPKKMVLVQSETAFITLLVKVAAQSNWIFGLGKSPPILSAPFPARGVGKKTVVSHHPGGHESILE